MKIAIALLVALVGAVMAEDGYGYRSHYAPGFRHVHEGIAAVYRNDVRQEQVNHVAEHYGSGTGTARFVGVPGTNGYYGYRHHDGYGHGGYGHGHGGYGHGAYGHGAYGGYNAGYGHAGHY